MSGPDLLVHPEPKRDRYGRYVLPHPETGKSMSWTRATTFASSIADTFALTKWQCRMTALGLGMRRDLLAQVQGITDPDSGDAKKHLGKLVDDAQEHAGSRTAANLGTALHTQTEHVDTGRWSLADVPEQWRGHVAAYRAAMDSAGMACAPEYVERIVCVPELEVVGTLDRLVADHGTTLIGDLKTGRELSYAWGEIAIQLCCYAHASCMWDWQAETWVEMPAVDQQRALVMHVPAVDPEPTCTLYEVDIEAAWKTAVPLAAGVRRWRKRKGLTSELAVVSARPTPVAPPADAERVAWALDRGRKLMADPRAKQMLANGWPDGVARPADSAGWTAANLNAVCAVLNDAEAAIGAPFPDDDPAILRVVAPVIPPPPVELPAVNGGNGDEVGADVLAAAAQDALTLPPERTAMVKPWKAAARRQGRPWPSASTQRGYLINFAALACLRHLWDDDEPEALVRAAMSMAIDTDVQPSWTTGAVFGSLSAAEAQRLERIASAFTEDTDVAAELGRRCVA